MAKKSDQSNPVSEDYEALFEEVGRTERDWPRQRAVAKIGVKIAWEMTEAVKEFSDSTQRLGRVNMWLTGVIAFATLVYAAVELFR